MVKLIQVSNNQIIRTMSIFVLLLIVAFLPRVTVFDESKVVCIHYYLFGFQCPLCGMTRAVYEFSHFNFNSAIKYNAVVALLPLYLFFDIFSIFFRSIWLETVRKYLVILILVSLIVIYVFRILSHFQWF